MNLLKELKLIKKWKWSYISIVKMYGDGFHCIRIRRNIGFIYWSSGTVINPKTEWCTAKGLTYSFTVDYGFTFRDWIRSIKKQTNELTK